MRHSIEYYLDEYLTLTPEDASLGEVGESDWWQYVKTMFDDVLWMDFGDRMVFVNNRFPYDNKVISYHNILRTFVITLKMNARNFERMYNVYMMDYNPLWNVDGVTGLISQDKHTGTDTRALTGTDTSVLSGTDRTVASGTDSLTHSGSDVDTLSGSDGNSHSVTKDDTTRTGNEVIAKSGHDDTERQVATFDSGGNYAPEQKEVNTLGSSDTHTYNNVKDAHELTESGSTTYGKVDTLQHGHVETTVHGKTDTMTYGKQDQITHNTQDLNTKNLTDEHIELNIRQGNIGVTMSQQLYKAEWDQWKDNMNNFVKLVVKTCVNKVSYGVEGVI